jgi:xanthine dehydrogenase accessory factor
MKNIETWKLIEQSLANGVAVMLLYVLESKGSSPGRQGFFMAVNAGNDIEGSIGGGIMEHKFAEMAKERLKEQGNKVQEVRKQIHDKEAATNQSGMICSGEQTIFLYPIRSNDADTIQQITHSLEANRNGSLHLSPKGISFSSTIPAKDFSFSFQSEEDWEYMEKTGFKNQLFIIGGGHCALAFSKLMRSMDFYIWVYEERSGLNTLVNNEFAHEIIIVDDYTALGNLIPSGPDQYVVIMTEGYRTDDIAIRALLSKQLNYLGVLGSKKKMEKLFAEYRDKGIPEDVLQRIQSPAGLAINSQTPEEIAVSIAAEIIKVKNKTPPGLP